MPKKPPTPLAPNNRRLVLAAIATFVFFAMPFAVWQITSNSDEPRYTLAAARMMATGDYIIPYAAWGEIRLLKPPLTYYYVVAGMGLFGQSVLAVKIMWLISAAAVLALTWQLARAIGADQRAAAMATAALGANLLFFQSALTHNPDMPMVLGLTLALLGFARLCDSAPAPRWAVFAAWGGLAWAFLAKGMLALVLAGVAVLVRVALHRLRRRPGLAWPGRPEWLAIGLALIGGGWWHAVVALRAPEALMAQFFGDQVSEKVALTLGDYLTGLVFFATAAVIGFVPVLLALVGRRTGDIGWRASHPLPGPVLLMGAWIITCIAIFAFSNFRVGRYMLPAMPALAALLALGFTGMSEAQLARRCGRAVRILVPLAGGVAILSGLILYMARMDAALWAWALGAAIFLGAVWWLAGRLGATAAAAAMVAILPGSVLMFLPGYFVLGTPAAADLALKALREGGFQPSEVYVLRRWHLVERVGLRLPPLQDYIFANDLDPALLSQARILIATSPADAEALQSLGWQTRIEHGTPEGFSASAFWEAVVTRDIAAFRKRHGEPLLIATRE